MARVPSVPSLTPVNAMYHSCTTPDRVSDSASPATLAARLAKIAMPTGGLHKRRSLNIVEQQFRYLL